MRTVSAVIALAAAAATALPASTWMLRGASTGSEVVDFSVALPQRNAHVIDEVLMAVSTPGSPRRGEWLTSEEANRITAPRQASREAARAWMSEHGISCRDMPSSLRCRGTTAAVGAALQTQFHEFENSVTGDRVHRIVEDTTFPEGMEEHVSFISGLTPQALARYGQVRAVSQDEANPSLYVVPETLTKYYSLATAKGDAKVVQAAIEFQGVPAFVQQDIDTFTTNCAVPAISIAKTIGPFEKQDFAESVLDVSFLGAVGQGNTNWYWTNTQWMYDYTEQLVGMTASDIPDVNSMSYGWSETDQCQISPSSKPCENGGSSAFVAAVNTNFAKVGAMGITHTVATGDSGAHGRTDGLCSTSKVHPAFPAASPYLTAVGATMVPDGVEQTGFKAPVCKQIQCLGSGEETVCSKATGALITSGGGFSEYTARMKYQDKVVSAYLQDSSKLPPSGSFNSSGRGFPDVAALGHQYYIEYNGEVVAVDGTSASCPVNAGILALVNAELVRNGKAKLGFANPTIYQVYEANPSAFNDITKGDNKCTEETCSGCTGFTAATGWDAATGLGSFNYPEFIKGMSALGML